jgi:hypothetical protein
MFFKGLNFGKKKDTEKGKPPANDTTATHIAELEEQLKDRTDGLVQTEKKLKRLSDKVNSLGEIDVAPELPHGPIGELAIEPVDALVGVDTDEEENTKADLEKEPEDENIVEVEREAKPQSREDRVVKSNLDADSLKALFTSEEKEVNPLVSLINSLPDITIDELMDDLKEIKGIIRDWQKK